MQTKDRKFLDGCRLLLLLKDVEKMLDNLENEDGSRVKLMPEERAVFAQLQVALERHTDPKAE